MPESLLHLRTVYGARAKLGIIVPPTNTANEAEWNLMAPRGVSVHAARMPLHTDTGSAAGQAALRRDIAAHAQDLAAAGVDVIVYACTAGSMLSPVDALAAFIRQRTGVRGLTTAQAIVDALRTLSVRRLAVATPYHDALNGHEQRFLCRHGVDVVAIEGLGFGANGPAEFRNIARVDFDRVRALARRVDRDGADALLLSCTDLATLAAIPELETELGKPVVSSNTATFWRALRLAGVDDRVENSGTLLTL